MNMVKNKYRIQIFGYSNIVNVFIVFIFDWKCFFFFSFWFLLAFFSDAHRPWSNLLFVQKEKETSLSTLQVFIKYAWTFSLSLFLSYYPLPIAIYAFFFRSPFGVWMVNKICGKEKKKTKPVLMFDSQHCYWILDWISANRKMYKQISIWFNSIRPKTNAFGQHFRSADF